MMDRAWTRLQAMPDDPEHRHERLVLTIRMFLDRGWQERARERLAEALGENPVDPELRRLAVQAERPLPPPPLEVPPVTAPPAEQLAAAEAFLRAGAFLKARLALEALDRLRPGDRRVLDLLWALQGDYDLTGTTLQHVAARYGGKARLAPHETAEIVLEPAESTPWIDEEDTQAMRLADLHEALEDEDTGGEDTQVLRVVGEAADGEAGPVSDVRQADVEDEDDVVVMVRHRDERPPPRTVRPLPSPPNVQRPPKRPIVATPMPDELEEVEDVEEVDEIDEVDGIEDLDPVDVEDVGAEPEPVATTPSGPSRTTIALVVAGAAILGVAGIALLVTLLWVRLPA